MVTWGGTKNPITIVIGFYVYSISNLSLLILSGKTRDKRIHKMAGINHGNDAPDNGRKLIRALSPASLNWLPITLSKGAGPWRQDRRSTHQSAEPVDRRC